MAAKRIWRLTDADRAQALDVLRVYCASHGRGVTQLEYDGHCAERGLRWRHYHLTQVNAGGVYGRQLHSWPEILARAGYTQAPRGMAMSAARLARRVAPPGSRRCQNAPECRRVPDGANRFCKPCRATWDNYAPDCGVVGLPGIQR